MVLRKLVGFFKTKRQQMPGLHIVRHPNEAELQALQQELRTLDLYVNNLEMKARAVREQRQRLVMKLLLLQANENRRNVTPAA